MMLIGVDYHPSFQAIAFFYEETGEFDERELNHSGGEAERFYRDLKERGIGVRVGMEATGFARYSERCPSAPFAEWLAAYSGASSTQRAFSTHAQVTAVTAPAR